MLVAVTVVEESAVEGIGVGIGLSVEIGLVVVVFGGGCGDIGSVTCDDGFG